MLKLVALLRFLGRSSMLVGVGVVGSTVTLAGVIMLITPGPGLAAIVTGLAILSTRFKWAERLLGRLKTRARNARARASAARANRRAAS